MSLLYTVSVLIGCNLFLSPGDSIGTTACDLQAYGSFGTRIMVDDYGQAHVDWLGCDYPGANQRYCCWNCRFTDGSYYGSTQASNSWSGGVQLDITRDTDPDDQRTVIAYHYNPGAGYYSWIDIDQGNCFGSWPNNPTSPQAAGHIWPYIACASNGNIVMANSDENKHYLYCTTDEGPNWTSVAEFDSCALFLFLRASHNSNKVVFVHMQYITDSLASGQLDNDVYYILSTDGGVTWGLHTNITNYKPYPVDSVRAYGGVNAGFDINDNLHVFWGGRRVDASGYYEASKIFHWDEVNDSITVVNSPSIYYNEPGGWWIPGSIGTPGSWRMPCDQPQCAVDPINNDLYCFWHGNDDTTDVSAAGYMNGEIFGSYSTDHGLTWSDYVNLTNTRSPGAPPGACDDEDYGTAHSWTVNDSIFFTYIEDKDAGAYVNSEGIMTENIVHCWLICADTMRTGVKEQDQYKPSAMSLQVAPNPFTTQTKIAYCVGRNAYGEKIQIYDASGRVVKLFPRLTPVALHSRLYWSGCDEYGQPVPAGVYFVTLRTADQSITTKVVKLR
jgi:hypothetical protein